MKKNSVRILALLLAALLALSACGGKDTTTQPGQPDNGGEAITDFVTFALQTAEMETFLILNSESQFDLNVLCNAYAPLLEVDAKGKLIPAVAREWGTEDGGDRKSVV